jgi:hypothetical protein
MIPVGLIVEDQVLQLASLDSHQHGAVNRADKALNERVSF